MPPDQTQLPADSNASRPINTALHHLLAALILVAIVALMLWVNNSIDPPWRELFASMFGIQIDDSRNVAIMILAVFLGAIYILACADATASWIMVLLARTISLLIPGLQPMATELAEQKQGSELIGLAKWMTVTFVVGIYIILKLFK